MIVVNGVQRPLPEPPTVGALLAELELVRDGVAVAVNRAVVPRSRHAAHVLLEGDQVEVIQAVGGG